AWLRD
ncbi:lydD, partial [Escherichia coli 5905]